MNLKPKKPNPKGSVYFTGDILVVKAGAIVLAFENSVSWHDAIPTKTSLCQENAVLLVVSWLCVTAAVPLVFGSTLTLPTFSLLFFRLC